MTKQELIKIAVDHHISLEDIHFKNSVEDGFYVLKNGQRWEVFFRERGKDRECVGFPSESDALAYLASKLVT